MIRPQLILDLHRELIVDNFAGGGGASTGIELALGRNVDHAINHCAKALGMHRINHPQTVHHCEDIFDIDPAKVTEGRPVGLAHFSPDCKHFSKAKGGKPLDKRIRGLVLVMLRWAKIGARVMTMENVEEITTWGPLKRIQKNGEWGWYPDPEHKGRTWKAFLSILSTGIAADHPDLPEILSVLGGTVTLEECVRGFGYQYEAREIRACDHDTPTIRKRLYMIARCDGKPIVWPEATNHGPYKVPSLSAKRLLPWRTIAECLDWSLPCPSIFLNKEEARVAKCRRPLAKSTLRRIAAGIDRYVLRAAEPFLVSLTHQGGDRVEPVSEPARTLTGAHRGEKALVSPCMLQRGHYKSNSAMVKGADEPMRCQATGAEHALVTGTLAPLLTEHANASGQRTFPATEPLRTQCGEVKGGHFAMVAGTLVQTGYGEREGQAPRALDPNKPVGTLVSGGKHAAITGTLIGAGGPAYSGKPKRVTGPMNAQTTENHAALASASLLKLRGDTDGHLHAPSLQEPGHTTSAGGQHHGLIAAHLTKFTTGSVGQELDKPGPTITAGTHAAHTHGGAATSQGVVAAYLAQHNAGFNETVGHPADKPVTTISQKGSQQQLVAASAVAYYGSEKDGQGMDEPARTPTTKPRLGNVQSTAVSPMTPEQEAGARKVAKFLRTHGVQFEGEFATVRGYVIVDIGMRMLVPRELYRAQGFPESYTIDRAWLIDPRTGNLNEVRLTKEEQIRFCGNSVCPPVMKALIAANVPELSAWFKGEGKTKKRRGVA